MRPLRLRLHAAVLLMSAGIFSGVSPAQDIERGASGDIALAVAFRLLTDSAPPNDIPPTGGRLEELASAACSAGLKATLAEADSGFQNRIALCQWLPTSTICLYLGPASEGRSHILFIGSGVRILPDSEFLSKTDPTWLYLERPSVLRSLLIFDPFGLRGILFWIFSGSFLLFSGLACRQGIARFRA